MTIKARLNISGIMRFFWPTPLYLIIYVKAFYGSESLHEVNPQGPLIVLAFTVAGLLLEATLHTFGYYQFLSLKIVDSQLVGRRYWNFKKYKFQLSNIVKIEKQQLLENQGGKRSKNQFGSRYCIHFNDNEKMDFIDILTNEYFSGIDELVDVLVKSKDCPVNRLDIGLLSADRP